MIKFTLTAYKTIQYNCYNISIKHNVKATAL